MFCALLRSDSLLVRLFVTGVWQFGCEQLRGSQKIIIFKCILILESYKFVQAPVVRTMHSRYHMPV